MKQILNYINGNFVKGHSEKFLEVINPAKGEVYAQVVNSEAQDVESAYLAAKAAFPLWSSMSINERSKVMLKIADLIELYHDDLALAEILIMGNL